MHELGGPRNRTLLPVSTYVLFLASTAWMVNSVLQTLTLSIYNLYQKVAKWDFTEVFRIEKFRIVHLILSAYDLTPLTIHVVLYLETCYKLSLNVFYYWALYMYVLLGNWCVVVCIPISLCIYSYYSVVTLSKYNCMQVCILYVHKLTSWICASKNWVGVLPSLSVIATSSWAFVSSTNESENLAPA